MELSKGYSRFFLLFPFLVRRAFSWRSFGATIVGLLFLASQSYAGSATTVTKQPPEEGLKMVRETSQRILSLIKEEGLRYESDQRRLYELVDEIVFTKFDFRRISSRVLGRNWRKATSEQREKFVKHFKAHLVRTYATALNKYHGQEIEYLPVRAKKSSREIKVQTRIKLSGASPIDIVYVLMHARGGDGSWKVVDVLVEGVSLVVTHRSSFQAEIRQKGLSGLIKALEERNLNPAIR